VRLQIEDPNARPAQGFAFFSAGFRPFFPFAGLSAAVTVLVWLVQFYGLGSLKLPFDPMLWHAHEMVFGFTSAVLAGFLLTAVPNWTGLDHIEGTALKTLFFIWLAGRLAFLAAGILPDWLVMLCDLSFIPILIIFVLPPIVQAGNSRNYIFLPLIAAFWATNIFSHLGLALNVSIALAGLHAGIYVALCLIALVGGRVIPSFTSNGLRMAGNPAPEITTSPLLDRWAMPIVALCGVVDVFLPGTIVTTVVMLFAAGWHFLRMSKWRSLSTFGQPLVWILHVGYFFLPLGLALRGLSAVVPAIPASASLHMLTLGAVGCMAIAIMSRAALGHSGRALKPSPITVLAYICIICAVLIRSLTPIFVPALQVTYGMGISGGLWSLGWLLFVWVYLPIGIKPRPDGRPG
jgi:uncharacterized protein involved in response to NO